MEKEKKERSYIVLAIVFLVLAIAGVVISSIILPVSVAEAMQQMKDSGNDPAATAAAAPFVALILVLFIFFAIVIGIIAIPLLVLSLVFLRRSSKLWIRILSFVLDAAYAYCIVVGVFKLIQLATGN